MIPYVKNTFLHRKYIGQTLYSCQETDSTNIRLLEQTGAPFVSGDVLTAICQSAGLGRHQRHWKSPEGGLYFSVLFEEIPALEHFYPLVLLLALAVRDTLSDASGYETFLIKWPNDLYYENHKISGILTQSRSQGAYTNAVIGSGINLNTAFADVKGLRNPAISLSEITGRTIPPESFLDEVLNRFDQSYQQWVLGNFTHYLPRLNQFLYGKGHPQQLKLPDREITVIPLEFTASGQLRCDVNGMIREISLGELM